LLFAEQLKKYFDGWKKEKRRRKHAKGDQNLFFNILTERTE